MNQPTISSTVSELLPCAHCGGEGHIYTPSFPMAADCGDIYISCLDCDATGPAILFDQDTHDVDDLDALIAEAIAAWNQRPASQADQGLAEAAAQLEQAERTYRYSHDSKGGGHIETGRAWDRMRRAGDKVRALTTTARIAPDGLLDDIAKMMGEFVDNWPKPKKVSTALKLIAKTFRALMDPPKHKYWGAGEPDCPREIKAGNGELHTLRCKVCGEDNPRNDRCLTALRASPQAVADEATELREARLRWYKPTDHPQDREDALWMAHGIGGRYSIQADLDKFILWLAGDEFAFITCDSVDACKATAETDWQKALDAHLAARSQGEGS